jgi:hypothetical protein
MPTMRFRLEKGGAKRLALSYKGYFKNMNVVLDGATILTVVDRKQLEAGELCLLPDGSTLRVKLAKRKLIVTRNGVAVPGSATDPGKIVKTAAVFLYIWAAGSVLLGTLEGDGPSMLIGVLVGAVLGVLGYFVWHLSTAALGVSIAFVAFSILLALIGAAQEPRLLMNLPITIVLLVSLIQGFRALRRGGGLEPSAGTTSLSRRPEEGGSSPPILKMGDRVKTHAGVGTVRTVTIAGAVVVTLDEGGTLATNAGEVEKLAHGAISQGP